MNLVMILIWLGLLVEIFVLYLLKPYIYDFESVSTIAVFFHVIYTIAILIAYKNKYNLIFLGAFLARSFLLAWDLYARHIFPIPNSGADSEMFINAAVIVSENISLLSGYVRGGIFTKSQAVLFHLIGPQIMLGQYINVLLGLSVVFVVYKILILLELEPRVVQAVILISAFFPNAMAMSAIFMRESSVTFFVVCSLYFFIKWFRLGKYPDMLYSTVLLGLASMFHSGVAGIYFGYAFVFMFYQQRTRSYGLNIKSVSVFLFLFLFAFLAISIFGDTILHDIQSADGAIDIYAAIEFSAGESVYLANLTINNPLQFIVYGPVRAFYFLTSPLPMNWRGPMDVFSFLYDSLFYLGTIIYLLINRRNLKDKKVLVFGLVLILICVSMIFGVGVSNAGTAIRHRQKIMPIFLILLAVLMDRKQRILEKKKREAIGGDEFNGTLAKHHNTGI